MKPVARFIKTPVGRFEFPLNPHFIEDLERCKTNEDLFSLVNQNGFLNPDALTEVEARGLYQAFLEWEKPTDASYYRLIN